MGGGRKKDDRYSRRIDVDHRLLPIIGSARLGSITVCRPPLSPSEGASLSPLLAMESRPPLANCATPESDYPFNSLYNFMACAILRVKDTFRLVSSCSQIRITRQPDFRRLAFTFLSRFLLRWIFRIQYPRFVTGSLQRVGWPCQKIPSTKTARRCFGKTKSGFPYILELRLQPFILEERKI